MPEFKLGDRVIIKECHKLSDLVGQAAKVVGITDPEFYGYPLQVAMEKALHVWTPLGMVEVSGPIPFRPDELELVVDTEVPDVFLKAMGEGDGKDKPAGN